MHVAVYVLGLSNLWILVTELVSVQRNARKKVRNKRNVRSWRKWPTMARIEKCLALRPLHALHGSKSGYAVAKVAFKTGRPKCNRRHF